MTDDVVTFFLFFSGKIIEERSLQSCWLNDQITGWMYWQLLLF
jgi:hypothetical protein